MGLGGGHPDLGPGPGVEHGVGLAGHGRVDHVGDDQHLGTQPARLPHGLEGVDRLAGLADPDDQGAGVEHRVAVAELAGDVDLHRQAGPVLDGVLGHQAGVVAAAAGHDEHLVDGPELLVGDVDLVEGQGPVGQQPVEQGVGHRPGLLVHLLAHVVVVAVLAGRLEVPVDVQSGRLDLARRRGR